MEQKKRKFPLWIYPDQLARVEKKYAEDNCSSQSEFICKAIEFYLSYLQYEGSLTAYAPILSGIISGTVESSEHRINRNMFKIAVELAKVSNILAAANELDDHTMSKLHIKCVSEVSRINGTLRYEDAVDYQQG